MGFTFFIAGILCKRKENRNGARLLSVSASLITGPARNLKQGIGFVSSRPGSRIAPRGQGALFPALHHYYKVLRGRAGAVFRIPGQAAGRAGPGLTGAPASGAFRDSHRSSVWKKDSP
jgi:hypothetical protein